jgi:hypothetical protein
MHQLKNIRENIFRPFLCAGKTQANPIPTMLKQLLHVVLKTVIKFGSFTKDSLTEVRFSL